MNIEPQLSTKTMAHIATLVVLIEEGAKPQSLHDLLVTLCQMVHTEGQLAMLRPPAPEKA